MVLIIVEEERLNSTDIQVSIEEVVETVVWLDDVAGVLKGGEFNVDSLFEVFAATIQIDDASD